ncbi:MAG: hypothetical protein OEZ38_12275 [Gammaproteobacteria bacterium]|nr:hypothetical protein [Gammaproteobacteria bacterium]
MKNTIQTVKTSCIQLTLKSCSFINSQVIPKTRQGLILSGSFCKHKVLPVTQKGARFTKNEFLKIHQKKNWFKRCGKTMVENSIGLTMAILSTKVVQHFVEVREFSNLWGLFATRPVVSEATYETISFIIELVIALLVFTISEHIFEEFTAEKNDHETINTYQTINTTEND